MMRIESVEGNCFAYTHQRKHTNDVVEDPRMEFPVNVNEIVSDLFESQQKLQEAEDYLAAKMECR